MTHSIHDLQQHFDRQETSARKSKTTVTAAQPNQGSPGEQNTWVRQTLPKYLETLGWQLDKLESHHPYSPLMWGGPLTPVTLSRFFDPRRRDPSPTLATEACCSWHCFQEWVAYWKGKAVKPSEEETVMALLAEETQDGL